MAHFDTLLIANRGEIACRVIRTARAIGVRTVAVYSDADASARHVREADASVRLGAGPARDSYLDAAKLVAACRASGAQAVHPGYGFLSENADFARTLREAGLVFVGPPPEAIEALGNKSAAKRLAGRLDVPCLPGYQGAAQDDDTLVAEARRVGVPLMIKAAAGGGGRGMRAVDDLADEAALRAAIASARAEAAASFGDGTLLIERRILRARHVEVQVFGDAHGGYVHLGERDCSTQRRNQKVLEEAPAPGVTDTLRARMGEAAIRLAREVGYVGAGTVEFLLEPDGAFWFLEMNTRLQVEHPVTEAVTGLDLVEWQLRIARGEALPRAQEAIRFQGHAIEARLCAEDPYAGFAPQVGPIDAWRMPEGPGLRVDHGLAEAAEVPPYYDSMIAKVIAHGSDREQARVRLLAALERCTVAGLRTNRDWLRRCLAAEPFATATLSTAWLGEALAGWSAPGPDARWLAVAAALRVHRAARVHGPLAGWSSSGTRTAPLRLEVAGREHPVRVESGAGRAHAVTFADGTVVRVALRHDDGLRAGVSVDGVGLEVMATLDRGRGWLDGFGLADGFTDVTDRPPRRDGGEAGGTIVSRMHGQLTRIAVEPGQRVERGTYLLSIEAMKMEHRFESPVAGIVAELGAACGTQVAPGRLLIRIDPDPA
ncbi:MAG: ATP-grasp domain-containing protein [Burkholderiales bacterium]|nr:MAG: ATP-grasp domain-containing protein [Burkholderiales bacterium]